MSSASVSSADDDALTHKRTRSRGRNMLMAYYGLKSDREAARNDDDTDVDSSNFNAQKYVTKLMKDGKLKDLLDKDRSISDDVQQLDSELQMLVYGNYTNFINATKLVSNMRQSVVEMEPALQKLKAGIESVVDTSQESKRALKGNREEIGRLLSVTRTLKKLEFIVTLPERLQDCVDDGNYTGLVRYWSAGRSILSRYSHVKSFANVSSQCSSLMAGLHDRLLQVVNAAELTTMRDFVDVRETNALLASLVANEPQTVKQALLCEVKASITSANDRVFVRKLREYRASAEAAHTSQLARILRVAYRNPRRNSPAQSDLLQEKEKEEGRGDARPCSLVSPDWDWVEVDKSTAADAALRSAGLVEGQLGDLPGLLEDARDRAAAAVSAWAACWSDSDPPLVEPRREAGEAVAQLVSRVIVHEVQAACERLLQKAKALLQHQVAAVLSAAPPGDRPCAPSLAAHAASAVAEAFAYIAHVADACLQVALSLPHPPSDHPFDSTPGPHATGLGLGMGVGAAPSTSTRKGSSQSGYSAPHSHSPAAGGHPARQAGTPQQGLTASLDDRRSAWANAYHHRLAQPGDADPQAPAPRLGDAGSPAAAPPRPRPSGIASRLQPGETLRAAVVNILTTTLVSLPPALTEPVRVGPEHFLRSPDSAAARVLTKPTAQAPPHSPQFGDGNSPTSSTTFTAAAAATRANSVSRDSEPADASDVVEELFSDAPDAALRLPDVPGLGAEGSHESLAGLAFLSCFEKVAMQPLLRAVRGLEDAADFQRVPQWHEHCGRAASELAFRYTARAGCILSKRVKTYLDTVPKPGDASVTQAVPRVSELLQSIVDELDEFRLELLDGLPHSEQSDKAGGGGSASGNSSRYRATAAKDNRSSSSFGSYGSHPAYGPSYSQSHSQKQASSRGNLVAEEVHRVFSGRTAFNVRLPAGIPVASCVIHTLCLHLLHSLLHSVRTQTFASPHALQLNLAYLRLRLADIDKSPRLKSLSNDVLTSACERSVSNTLLDEQIVQAQAETALKRLT
ncbi:Vacuolar protein sorting-associated protein 51-like protein [Diplonema papillatum]|nr:Vacuolar protein sorting-associated protein 51-like protein [Diplonema papillatum]